MALSNIFFKIVLYVCLVAPIIVIAYFISAMSKISLVAKIARDENISWRYWSGFRNVIYFIVYPGEIIEPNDSIKLQFAKRRLIKHIKLLKIIHAAVVLIMLLLIFIGNLFKS